MSNVLIKSCATCTHHAQSKDWCLKLGMSATPLQCRCKGADYVKRMEDRDKYPAMQKKAEVLADAACHFIVKWIKEYNVPDDIKYPRAVMLKLLIDELKQR